MLIEIAPIWLIATALQAASLAPATPRETMRRDLQSYAIASCFTEQKSEYLRDQGDGWASNLIQRGNFTLPIGKKVSAAVDVELAQGNMAKIMLEDPPMTLQDLPVQYCAEIIHTPRVSRAIEAGLGRQIERRRK